MLAAIAEVYPRLLNRSVNTPPRTAVFNVDFRASESPFTTLTS